MDEALKKLLGEMSANVKALNESIVAKFSSVDPKSVENEKDKLIERILNLEKQIKTTKSVQKMAWAVKGKELESGVEGVGFNKFLKAVANNDLAFLDEMKASSGQSEGTNADGGYAVPVEYANEIVKLERQSGIVRGLARIFPMSSLTRKIPSELAKPSVYWVGEGTEPTLSKGTLSQITQTAKKLMAIVPFSDELLEDNNVGYETFIAETIAQELGREEDKQALVGDVSGSSDPFNGVFFESGVNSVSLLGANLTYADLVELYMAPGSPYRNRGAFVLSSTALKKCMRLIDDNGRPIWTMSAADGVPGRLLGRPYYETDQIPDTLGTTRSNGTNTGLIYGAFDGLWISPRGGYTVKASDSASNAAGKSAFALDETWFKFRRRQAITVANPEAFAKLQIPAA